MFLFELDNILFSIVSTKNIRIEVCLLNIAYISKRVVQHFKTKIIVLLFFLQCFKDSFFTFF